MVSPARVAAFITGTAGVVAALGTATNWLGSHFSPDLVYYVGVTILAVGTTYAWFLFHFPLKGRYRIWVWRLYMLAVLAVIFVGIGAIRANFTHNETAYSMAYVYAGLAVIPVFWLSYQLDRTNHRECPMCCERIKAGAQICRHCGSSVPKVESPQG